MVSSASLWGNPSFLKRCEALQQLRGAAKLEAGQRIARGFADLGYEEFLLLQGGKLSSLYTGKSSDFPEAHAHFFFPVPSADDLVRELTVLVDIIGIEFKDQRTWNLTIQEINSTLRETFSSDTLEEVLIEALIKKTPAGKKDV